MNCKCGHDTARHTNGYCQACPSRCRHFEASEDGLERTLVTPIGPAPGQTVSDYAVFKMPEGKEYVVSGDATVMPAEQSKVYQKWLADQIERQRAAYKHPISWGDKIVGFVFSVIMLLVLIGPVSAAVADSAKIYSPQNQTVQTVLGIVPLMGAVVVLLSIVGMISIGDK